MTFSSIRAWATNVGIATDIWLSVLTGGLASETISTRVARSCSAGSSGACFVCRWLSATVEKGHCGKVLLGVATTPHAALLAGLQLLAAFVLVVYGPWLVWGLF